MSRIMQKWNRPPACSDHWCIESCLPIGWRTFIWRKSPPKCCSILVWIARCWNSLLTSRNPKNIWCLFRIFVARFGEKDHCLSTCKPWSKQVGGWTHFCTKQLRTLNSYKIFKIKNNKKAIAVDVLFKAYPMVPLSCRSNLARRYICLKRRSTVLSRCGFPLTVGIFFTFLWRLVKQVFKDIKSEIKLR
jgi:hypothetical protein